MPDPAAAVHKIISSPNGLSSLQAAMRHDLSPSFCNDRAATLIEFISSPELITISGGDFLRRVLLAIVEPPIFWDSFAQAFRAGLLQEKAQRSFAFLLLHTLLLFSSDESAPFLGLAEDQDTLSSLVNSQHQSVRVYGEKIKAFVDAHKVGIEVDLEYGPGGRHDNDKVDYREISILPTAEEIASLEAPFLRTSTSLDDPVMEGTRAMDYLDNQFRLLREDMLYEMREEMKIAFGKTKRIHRNKPIEELKLLRVFHERDDISQQGKNSRRRPWAIALERIRDFPHLAKVAKKNRISWMKDNRWFLKHGSMACILVNDEHVGFGTIDRDEDLLARNPPIIVLQLEGEATITRTLLKLKVAQRIKLVQIDTAVFAYEPVLKALQETRTVPLAEELLFWEEEDGPVLLPNSSPVVDALRVNPSRDLQSLINTPKSVVLDESQSQSLLIGLTQTVSLIQGPPG
jgi:hypothetical protein